jgi:hypothetical protein
MTKKYFAYNWLMDFDTIDLNRLLHFVDANGLELRRSSIGNKYLRFALAVDDKLQLYQFLSTIGEDASIADWHSIPYTEFEAATPVEHAQEHRKEILTTLDLMRKYTYETSKFYQEVYKSNANNKIYQTQWIINKKGLDERVVETAFDAVENWDGIRMSIHRPDLASYIDIYIVLHNSLKLDELKSHFPTQIAEAVWVEIKPDDVPDEVSGHPYTYDANLYAAWREGLYEWLLQSKTK